MKRLAATLAATGLFAVGAAVMAAPANAGMQLVTPEAPKLGCEVGNLPPNGLQLVTPTPPRLG